MKIQPKSVKKFQQGGPIDPNAAPAEGAETGAPVEGAEEAPAEGGQEDPMMMIAQAAAQALQTQDCQVAMQVCQALLQLIQQMQGGGAPAEPQGEPVFRKGGVLSRRINNK